MEFLPCNSRISDKHTSSVAILVSPLATEGSLGIAAFTALSHPTWSGQRGPLTSRTLAWARVEASNAPGIAIQNTIR